MGSTFNTAPPWFRPILRAEELLLPRIYPLLARSREVHVARAPGPLSNSQRNIVGNPTAERAVPGHVPGWVMGQHVARYAWAMNTCAGLRVAEIGAGDGYGASLLSWTASEVSAVELDKETSDRAAKAYPHVRFVNADATHGNALPPGDVAVAFEIIEHVPEAELLIQSMLARYPRLLLSFPNPVYHGTHLNPHHRQDWTLGRLQSILRQHGASAIQTFHQQRRFASVLPRAYPWSSIWILEVRV